MEKWKNIEGCQISNRGNVRSVDRIVIRKNGRKYTVKGKILSQSIDNKGYLRCSIGKIHKLVAEAFVPNPNNYTVVHHKDHNKLNNNAENLEWIDSTTHNRKHGGKNPCKKTYQYTLDGVLIAVYTSVQEAARNNNINYSNIARCCRNVQSNYKGYKWSYIPL